MASSRRNILISGMGRFISADAEAFQKFGPSHLNQQQLNADIAQATEAGYDCDTEDINPNDAQDSLKRVRDRLKSKRYDAYIIGYGIRGKKDHTALYERVVNLAVEVSPTTRFGFSTAPDTVFETIKRVLPAES
ncbi:Hypothetical predicted protein [Lecanosticta acicola]|uniref:Uncharacterized protein n=1 Tax=Lecanosticta acicola TaxID=111012 RepID=A0AAI8Z1X1_9PEZI|nr:Hypothetical predicted protein [Lecanosticta acicola]